MYKPPITAPPVIADSPLADDDGWVHADPNTLATGYDGVYAIGDTNQILLANGKPLPRAGVFAHSQAHTVADTIIAAIAVTLHHPARRWHWSKVAFEQQVIRRWP